MVCVLFYVKAQFHKAVRAANIIRVDNMFTLAALQSSVLSVKYGISIDSALAEAIINNPVQFDTVIPKGNIPMVALPAVTIGKGFDAEKASYIGFDKSEDGQYLNLTLTNTKPKTSLDTNKDVIYMLSTKYSEVDNKDARIKSIIAALK